MATDSLMKVESTVLQNAPKEAFCNTFDLHVGILVTYNRQRAYQQKLISD